MDNQQILTSVSDELKEKVRKALLVGRGIAIFAGAGISVPSGIKTFRGLNQMDYFDGYPPSYLCTMEMFKKSPNVCWKFFKQLYTEIKVAEPSVSHKILANWQSKYKNRPNSFCIITPNFDGLLSKAGIDPVYELHGNINTAKCLICAKSYDMNSLNLEELPPRCECGEVLKPNISLLNDYVDEKAYEQAMRISCAFYFCIGTSGVNHHAANFLQMVKDKKMATFIEINPRATNLTKDMDYVLKGNVEDILPQF